jgi:hypothetical protein
MPQPGKIVEFSAVGGSFRHWICKLGAEPSKYHRDGTVRVKLGGRTRNNWERSECLDHPNHFGNVSLTRELTEVEVADAETG